MKWFGESKKQDSESVHQRSIAEEVDPSDDNSSMANGIAEIEAVTQSWTRAQLYLSWSTLILTYTAMVFQTSAIGIYANYATASFTQYSLLSTIDVVNGVVSVVMKPILAKIVDSIGRLEGFIIGIFGLTLGAVLLAASPNIGTYFAGQVFLQIGQISFDFMSTCFALDSSDLSNRAFMIVISSFSYLFSPWAVAPMTTRFLEGAGWRWGIGIWAIITPVCSLPLFIVLVINRAKARRLGFKRQKLDWKKMLLQMDLIGIGILSAGLALVFVAIPLASTHWSEWGRPHIIVMIALGGCFLIAFPIYEIYVPKYPTFTLQVFKNWAINLSFMFIFFYYLAYYIYAPYHFGWLMVVMNLGNTAAANIDNSTTVATTVCAIGAGIIVKYTRRLKWAILSGGCVLMVGFGLIYKFRDENTTTLAQLVIPQLLYGAGAGIMTNPNSVFVQSFCSHEQVATTVSLYMSFLSLGQVVGDSVSGAIYRQHYLKRLKDIFPNKSASWVNGIFNDYTQALEYPMGSDTRIKINHAYNEVMRLLLIPPLVFYALMVVIGAVLPDIKLDKCHHGLKGIILGEPEPVSRPRGVREADPEHTGSENDDTRAGDQKN